MADPADELRVLRFIAENGGPSGATNLAGRGTEIGVGDGAVEDAIGALQSRGLVDVLEDGDVRLTAAGRAFAETVDI